MLDCIRDKYIRESGLTEEEYEAKMEEQKPQSFDALDATFGDLNTRFNPGTF